VCLYEEVLNIACCNANALFDPVQEKWKSPITHRITKREGEESDPIYVFDAKDSGFCWEASAAWRSMEQTMKQQQ
jgi:hypothetical protein